jgi:hypothetical protein
MGLSLEIFQRFFQEKALADAEERCRLLDERDKASQARDMAHNNLAEAQKLAIEAEVALWKARAAFNEEMDKIAPGPSTGTLSVTE